MIAKWVLRISEKKKLRTIGAGKSWALDSDAALQAGWYLALHKAEPKAFLVCAVAVGNVIHCRVTLQPLGGLDKCCRGVFPAFRTKDMRFEMAFIYFPASSPLTRDSEIFQLQACGRVVFVHRSCEMAEIAPLCPIIRFWCPLNYYASIWCHEGGEEIFDEWHDCWDAGEGYCGAELSYRPDADVDDVPCRICQPL